MNESNRITGFEALFKAAASGDTVAFWGLILDLEYNRIIEHYLTSPKKLGLAPTEAEEIKNAFMMHLKNQWPTVKPIANPRAYLRSAIRNFYISQTRKPDAHTISLEEASAVGFRADWHKKDWHKTDNKSLMGEKISASFTKLPRKAQAGVENAALFIKKIHDVGAKWLENQYANKYARSYELLVNLETRLGDIWGRGVLEVLSEWRTLKDKKSESLSKEEKGRQTTIREKYPVIYLIDTVNKEKERALKSSLSLIWGFDLSFLLIFDGFSGQAQFFKLRINPSRLLFDVFTKMPEMRGPKYLNLKRIELAMRAVVDNNSHFSRENLRQYRYRELSRSRLYKHVVNRIYKLSFKDGVNIDRPFDMVYQLYKEGRIEGANKEDMRRTKQIRDQQRKVLRQRAVARNRIQEVDHRR
jgi:hypothetical protein